MQFIKIGDVYVNMALVQEVHIISVPNMPDGVQLSGNDFLVVISDRDEVNAVLAWLNRNSIDVLRGMREPR